MLILNYMVQGLLATGLKKDEIFIGDINSVYKSGNTTVDVKVDTYSNVSEDFAILNWVWLRMLLFSFAG